MKKIIQGKKKVVTAVTDIGFVSYPYFVEPDEGRENSDNKYKCDLFVLKSKMKEETGKLLVRKTIEVAEKFFKETGLRLSDFKSPLLDIDKLSPEKRKELPEPVREGYIRIRAKRLGKMGQPILIDSQKEDLSEKEILAIKGGDLGRMQVGIFGYNQQGGGIAYGLNLFQFVKHGKAFGQGKTAALAMLDDIEVDVEDLDDEEETDDGTSNKRRKRSREDEDDSEEERHSKRNRKSSKDDDSDEDTDASQSEDEDSEDTDEEPRLKKKKKVSRDDEEDDFD